MTEQRRQKTPLLVSLIVAFVALFAVFVWRRKVSQPQCDELLDHYAELVVKEQHPDAGTNEIVAERQREREEAKRSDEFKNCTSEVQTNEHACAMKAQSSDALIKCLE